jgi:hypothetical protein
VDIIYQSQSKGIRFSGPTRRALFHTALQFQQLTEWIGFNMAAFTSKMILSNLQTASICIRNLIVCLWSTEKV